MKQQTAEDCTSTVVVSNVLYIMMVVRNDYQITRFSYAAACGRIMSDVDMHSLRENHSARILYLS